MAALLGTIATQRADVIARIAGLAPAERAWRPDADTWSAIDVLEHLVVAEQSVLGDLDAFEVRPDARPTVRHRLRAVLVRLVLQSGLRVQVPDAAMRPRGGRSFEALCLAWEDSHAALCRLVARLDDRGLRRRVFRHPIAGPLDVRQALRLLSVHIGTHTRQLERLATGRPASVRDQGL